MSAGFTGDFIKDTIREIEMAVRMCSADSRSNRIVKQLERMKKTWKIRLERLENQDRKDDFLCWEALGSTGLRTTRPTRPRICSATPRWRASQACR